MSTPISDTVLPSRGGEGVYRILIVDDEPMALYSAAHAFPWARFGFDEPVTTTNPRTALEWLRTQSFDAAIVDIRMPDLSGIDLIRLGAEEGMSTVFLVLSGYTDFEYVQTVLRLHAFDYCLKPILPDAAEAALTRLSQRLRASRCVSDPDIIAALNAGAPLKRLFGRRGLPVPEGTLSMALITAPKPQDLPQMLGAFRDSLLLWASERAVLAFSPMPESALHQALQQLTGAACCYIQPVPLEALNPVRQIQLLQETLLTLRPSDPPAALRVNDCSPAFLELLNYVDQHLIEDLSLQELSARFHLNYTYCSELFRSVTGQTFTKYLASHRMERAAELIAGTAVSMTEIARQTGYSNYNHFSTTFKGYFGQTPGAYRAVHQEQGESRP